MSTPDDFNELEEMLDDLSVHQPSQMLNERIAATLSGANSGVEHTHRPRPHALIWTSAAAVLVIAGIVAVVLSLAEHATDSVAGNNPEDRLAITSNPDQTSTNKAAIQPVNLVWSRDTSDQLRYTPSGKPYRAVVRELIDQRVWVDPDTGATMQATTPRQALYIVEQPVY